MYEAKLKKMGIDIPEAPVPLAAYVPGVQVGDMIYTSGQVPLEAGELKYKGKIGSHLSLEQGYAAAKLCVINCLSVVKSMAGSLDRIEKIVKLTGYVNSDPGFTDQPKILNGASEFLAEVFGEAGKHARAAVGVCELPIDSAVEIEMIVKLK